MVTQITFFYNVLMLFLETAIIFSELTSCPFLYFTDTVFHDYVSPLHATELLSKQLIQHVSDHCLHITLLVPYTGCPRRNVPDFGRVFLMLNYTDITQNTYVQS